MAIGGWSNAPAPDLRSLTIDEARFCRAALAIGSTVEELFERLPEVKPKSIVGLAEGASYEFTFTHEPDVGFRPGLHKLDPELRPPQSDEQESNARAIVRAFLHPVLTE